MSEQFSGPGSASGIQWGNLDGSLLLFEVQSLEHGIKTVYKETDAIRANIHVIDGDEAGEAYIDALVFPKVLQGQLRGRIGGMVVGRLGQGEKKSGQQPPWKLSEPNDSDRAAATAYLDRVLKKTPF